MVGLLLWQQVKMGTPKQFRYYFKMVLMLISKIMMDGLLSLQQVKMGTIKPYFITTPKWCLYNIMLIIMQDNHRSSPLMVASKNGHTETVSLLLHNGAEGASPCNLYLHYIIMM